MRHNRLSKINGAVDDALLLLSLQDPWDDGLCSYSIASVVHYYCPQGVETLHIHRPVSTYSVQVISRRSMGGSIATELTIVVPHVEAQTEEDVVPDEHLHARFLAGVDRHNIAINDCHGPTSGSSCKVTVDLYSRKKKTFRKHAAPASSI